MFSQWGQLMIIRLVSSIAMFVAEVVNFTSSIAALASGHRILTSRVSAHAYILSLVVIAMFFTQCATPVAPKGGPKDKTSPSVVVEESSPNPMINFNLKEIRITLDEWVKLNNASAQIVISPPIEPRPIPKLDRKTVVIPIDLEAILDNTTYTINFGESIQDITERNSLINYTYVFSKGPYVDSLSISGTIIDATTGLPMSGVRFILHDNPSDSAILKVLPSYFTTTDEDGNFLLEFLRPDTFRAYAIVEAEYGNFRYDMGEQFGFLNGPIVLNDTITPHVRLSVYTPSVPLRAGSPRWEYDTWKVALTREVSNFGLGGDTTSIAYWTYAADTVKLWHISLDTLQIELLEAGVPFDTVSLLPFVPEARPIAVSMLSKNRHPDDATLISTGSPLESVNKSLVSITQGDTADITAFTFEIDPGNPRKVLLKAKWTEKSSYHIRMLPGAMTDVYQNSNDTLLFVVSFDERINFGLLNLTVTGLDSTLQYILKLMDNQIVVEERIIESISDSVLVFNRLAAKDYNAKIIEDRNANSMWDGGDFETKRQPERIFIQKLEGMRPGWDLDLTIRWPEK